MSRHTTMHLHHCQSQPRLMCETCERGRFFGCLVAIVRGLTGSSQSNVIIAIKMIKTSLISDADAMRRNVADGERWKIYLCSGEDVKRGRVHACMKSSFIR
ncbi:hypothetical protein MRB53_041665 [Persea americana]|nr:hypothetical protein MRB53_041665 [Persea americana]